MFSSNTDVPSREEIMGLAKKHAEQKYNSTLHVIDNCRNKMDKTNELLQKLYVKKQKLEEEISNLEKKQSDRKKYLTGVQKESKAN